LGTDLSSDLLENLTSLELLESATVTSKCTAEKLGRMTQLRVLSVIIRLSTPDDEEWSACTNALVESLGKLTRIESLQIHHHRFYPIDLEGSMAEPLENLCRLVCIDLATLLPGWIQPASLPILSYLEIDVRDERREDIKVLGTLSCLRHLVFRVRLAPELQVLERCVVGPDAFPCLVSCEFHVRGGGVVPGIFPRGAMPRLQNFKFSVKPEHFWSGGGSTVDVLVLGHLPSLRSVTVTLGFLHNREDDTIKSVREKLEHEAAAHPNHPLRILFTS
jgi:disease resistance protein RPM1